MKKQLTLKLIESNDIPQIGDIDSHDGHLFLLDSEHDVAQAIFLKSKLIKPIAISDEPIKVDDNYLLIPEDAIKVARKDFYEHRDWKKIEILPEQFPTNILEAIVEGRLINDDTIEVEYECNNETLAYYNSDIDHHGYSNITVNYELKLDSNNKAIITYNTFKVVSKEELESRRSSAYEYAKFNYSIEEILNIIDDTEEELMKEVGDDYEYNGVSHYIEILKNKLKK